jgi:hypothetical protein
VDAGLETVDEDLVAWYLGYDVCGLDASEVVVVSPLW